MLSDRTASLDEVAAALGLEPRKLKRHWRRLHAREAFPPPLPGADWRWSRRAVEAWIDAGAEPAMAPANDDAPAPPARRTAAVAAAQKRLLQERYGGQG